MSFFYFSVSYNFFFIRLKKQKEEQEKKRKEEVEKKKKEEEEKEPVTLKEFENAAKKAYKDEKYEKALEYYTAVVEKFVDEQTNSDRARVTSNICQCYMKLNKWVDAYHSANKAIKFDEKNVKAWYRLGLVLLHMRQYDLAQETFEKSLEIDPSSKACHEALVGVFEARANTHEGVYDWLDVAERYRKGKFLHDYHDYIHPAVRIESIEGKGRGLIVTENVKAGTLEK